MKNCNDPNCTTHGLLKTRGRMYVGTVIKSKAHKTVTIEWARKKFIPKYERYLQMRTRVAAHNPECMDIQQGDIVRIKECRPLSKTKHFVVTEKIGTDILFAEKEELKQEAAHKPKEKKDEAS